MTTLLIRLNLMVLLLILCIVLGSLDRYYIGFEWLLPIVIFIGSLPIWFDYFKSKD